MDDAMLKEYELTTLRAQAVQTRETIEGCPQQCFAHRFLRDYVKIFDLLEESEKRYKKLKARYNKLEAYCKKLERKIEVLNGWQDTVDENNESR